VAIRGPKYTRVDGINEINGPRRSQMAAEMQLVFECSKLEHDAEILLKKKKNRKES
jgi:hypothetical protein